MISCFFKKSGYGTHSRVITALIRDSLKAVFTVSIENKEPFKHKFRSIWPDGSTHWIYICGEPEYSEEGLPIRLRGAGIDITELEEAKTSIDALERAVQDRTKKLKLASEAKADFLANMSHEIRNPLNTVTILTKLLDTPGIDEEKRKLFIKKISAATLTVTDLIDDFLDFSKIEANQLLLEDQPFRLNELIDDVASSFSERAQQKDLSFYSEHVDRDGYVTGDRKRLQQVLSNLIGNAIKFTESGSIRFRTSVQHIDPQSVQASFSVIDTGVGIEKEAIDHIFEPFTQANRGITRRFGGTGLGLSISKRLVDLMGGHLTVESTPGLGSTFGFTLHLHSEGGDLVGNSPNSLGEDNSLKGLRILMVDDETGNLEVLGAFLTQNGASIETAGNGAEACDLLFRSRAPFDVVLMDIQMPVMDGIMATESIRRDPRFANLPIIAITAGVHPEQQQKAINAGITRALKKPLDPEQLLSELLQIAKKLGDGSHI